MKGCNMVFFLRFLTCTCLVLSVNNVVQSQCIADAGNDTIICGISAQSLVLGGSVVAQGGAPPYTYKWEAEEYLLNEKKTASFFLDDTTKAHPAFVEDWGKSVTFKLTVTDSLRNTCSDSVKVTFCDYTTPMEPIYYFVDKGDTVELEDGLYPDTTLVKGCGPLEFRGWMPNYAISDTGELSVNVWPDSTITYTPQFVDSGGCYIPLSGHKVVVEPTGFEEFKRERNDVKVNPNPFSSTTTFNFHDQSLKILEVYDNAGKQVRIEKINSNRAEFNRKELKAGVYFFRVFDSKRELIDRGKLVIID